MTLFGGLKLGVLVPNPNKAKGSRFEREIVKRIESYDREAKRAWGSNGKSLGMHAEVDLIFSEKEGLEMAGWEKIYKVQAKCRKKIASFLKPSEHVDMQIVKEDRGKIYVIMELDNFLEIAQ